MIFYNFVISMVVGPMNTFQQPVLEYSSNEGEVENTVLQDVIIPNCDGILRCLWNTKIVILHNENGQSIAKGICHYVNFENILGSNRLLGKSHVVVHISKFLQPIDVLLD